MIYNIKIFIFEKICELFFNNSTYIYNKIIIIII